MESGPRRLGSVRDPGLSRVAAYRSQAKRFSCFRKLGRMDVVQGILIVVSVVVFIYLGVAMFKPEWF
jgi:K+-transporting ATPase KdpF subunit